MFAAPTSSNSSCPTSNSLSPTVSPSRVRLSLLTALLPSKCGNFAFGCTGYLVCRGQKLVQCMVHWYESAAHHHALLCNTIYMHIDVMTHALVRSDVVMLRIGPWAFMVCTSGIKKTMRSISPEALSRVSARSLARSKCSVWTRMLPGINSVELALESSSVHECR